MRGDAPPITATVLPKDGSPVLFQVVNTGSVPLADYGFWFDEEPLFAISVDPALTSLEVAGTA